MMIVLTSLYFLSLVILLISEKKPGRLLAVIGNGFLIAGWGLHSYVMIKRGIDAQRIPLTDMYETVVAFSWLVVAVSFYAQRRFAFRWIKISGLLAGLGLAVFASFLNDAIGPMMPVLKSGWLYVHVGAYFIAYASFAVAFGLSVVFIVNFWRSRGRNTVLLDNLEGIIFWFIDTGFPFLTIGLVCGSLWANITWGRFWNWDAKEVWALATWLIYAGCLHLRHAKGFHGLRAALLAFAGFVVILFTYFGVNLSLRRYIVIFERLTEKACTYRS